jgi:ATP-dependent Clp protease adaptor protein ClpS
MGNNIGNNIEESAKLHFHYMMDADTKKETKKSESKDNFVNLIVWNDDVHSFDYVIDCLIQICDHSGEQAAQCTYLIHYKGKCEVKSGPPSIIKKMRDRLSKRGLSVTVE